MFTDKTSTFTTAKTSCSTNGLFNKAKGAYSSHKEKGIRTYFSNLAPSIKNQVINAFRQNSKTHQIHGHELEDELKSKMKTYEKYQSDFEKKQNKLAQLNENDEKYPKADLALKKAESKVTEVREAISALLAKNPVEVVSSMFEETVKLGSQTVANQLKDVEAQIENIVASVLPAENRKREEAKEASILSIQGVVDQARKIVGV